MSVVDRSDRLDQKIIAVARDKYRALQFAVSFLVILGIIQFVVLLQQGSDNRRFFAQEAAASIATHNALCTYKRTQERSLKGANQFLEDHPNGIAGIPVALIQQNIAQTTETLKSLDQLTC